VSLANPGSKSQSYSNPFAKSKNASIRRLGFVPQPNLQKNGEDIAIAIRFNSWIIHRDREWGMGNREWGMGNGEWGRSNKGVL